MPASGGSGTGGLSTGGGSTNSGNSTSIGGGASGIVGIGTNKPVIGSGMVSATATSSTNMAGNAGDQFGKPNTQSNNGGFSFNIQGTNGKIIIFNSK